MVTLANILRIVNVLLAVGYAPLLYFRMRDSSGHYNRYMIGVWFLLVSIVLGAYAHRADTFNFAIPFCTLGLVTMIWDSSRKQAQDVKMRRNGVPRDQE